MISSKKQAAVVAGSATLAWLLISPAGHAATEVNRVAPSVEACQKASQILKAHVDHLRARNATLSASDLEPLLEPKLQAGVPVGMDAVSVDSPSWREGWIGSSPPKGLVQSFLQASISNAADCLAPSRDLKAGREIADGGSPSAIVERISMPVTDETASMALVVIDADSRPSGRITKVIYLKKVGGSWIEAGSRAFSVS